jgi:hypothetical protein
MRSHIRPSYRHDRDPARRLLAAVLWQAVKEGGSRNVRHQSSGLAANCSAESQHLKPLHTLNFYKHTFLKEGYP